MATTKYDDMIKKLEEVERLIDGRARRARSQADEIEDLLRDANKVFKTAPQVKEENTFTDWKNTFVVIPRKSVYTGNYVFGPAYKRTRTKQRVLHVDGKRVGGMRGGLLERGIGGKPRQTTEYATGKEIFHENLKRAGNNDIQN